MATERTIDSWVYPMDSSCTPYNDTDFNNKVRVLCQEEVQYMLSSTNESVNNQQSQTNKLPPLEPLKNRLRIAKCNVVGDTSVGKTCLVNRFGYDVFDSKSKATIGVDFDVQKFSILNRPFTLQIWDTAGDERFRSITRAYYRGAHAALIVFDLTTIKSFQNVGLWHDEIMEATQSPEHTAGSLTLTRRKSQRGSNSQHSSSRPFLFLVGTKKDLITDETAAFYRSEGSKLANKIGAEFWMVSSNTGENVTDLFKRVACLCFDRYLLRELHVQQDRTSQYEQYQRAMAAMVPDNQNSEQNVGHEHSANDRLVHYSAENGGKVAFFYQDEKRNRKTTTAVDQALWPLIVEWWCQWFGQHGKIRRRLGHVTGGNKVVDQCSTNNNNKSKRLDDKSHRKFQCFRFTCLYNVD
ncbi:Ras- protein Rab-34 [Dermatophagoides farinae]|uniref:Ras- protein Rab-34 n=1 Tax=Dermatophagoides farinae TaxID=6954 RepID=A0A922I4A2_DERFA|nr:Ras- protein Rab-34 [Dermatophagoides farinae]